jgi:threonine synthase
MTHLRCSDRACDATLDLHARALACPQCGELLEVAPDRPQLSPDELKRLWSARRQSFAEADSSGVWRYRELLPPFPEASIITLQEGNVPLVTAPRSAAWAGVDHLAFKHLGWNPTGCFKDLGMTVGMTEACFIGAKVVACASTGNTAGSLAAYAARAGIAGRVYLPSGQVSANKLAQSLDYGAEVVEIAGSFDDALNRLLELSGDAIYFLNSVNPFRIEGQKTAMVELMEQCGWRPPDYLIVPGGNLGNTAAFGKAFREMIEFGLIDRAPRMVVVQAAGANPFATMWREGRSSLQPVEHPETEATAIRIGNPRSWKKAWNAVRETGGMVLDVTDEEIAAAKAVIGRDGIGCEPASATTLAGLRKLREDDTIDSDASIVAVLTGHVLKDTAYILRHDRSAQVLAQAH